MGNLFYEQLQKDCEPDNKDEMETNAALRILLDIPLTPEMRKWSEEHFDEMLNDLIHKLAKVMYDNNEVSINGK